MYPFYYSIFNDLAIQTGALRVTFEPRYFDNSEVAPNLSTENMRYLTIEQTLADYHEITSFIKSFYGNGNNPVVVIGYALSASYAVWLRKLYPDDFNFVVASGPQLDAKLEFSEFIDDIFDNLIQYGSSECVNIIDDAFEELLSLIAANNGDQIQEIFTLRESLDTTNPKEVSHFFEFLLNDISNVIQPGNYRDIEEYCQLFEDDEASGVETSLQKFANVIGMRNGLNKSFNYTTYVEHLKNIDYYAHIDPHQRQDLYFQCTQRSWFHTTNTNLKMVPLSYYTDLCVEVFGSNFTVEALIDGNNRTNELFGGAQPEIDHVIYINGMLNPYRLVGFRVNVNFIPIFSVLNIYDYGLAQELFLETGSSAYIEDIRAYIKVKVLDFLEEF